MNGVLLFLFMTLVTFRISWLITQDAFPPIERVRNWATNKFHYEGKGYQYRDEDGDLVWAGKGVWHWVCTLLTCNWCMTVWVAGGVTLVVNLFTEMSLPWLWFGAVAGAAAIVCQLIQRVTEVADKE